MKRPSAVIAALILLTVCGLALAAENAAVGVWKIVSANGEEQQWTMTIKEDGGKLAGVLTGEMGEFPLVDPKLDGSAFTFKVTVGDVEYTVKTKISGKELAGTYQGGENQGTVKGTKQ